MTVSHAVLSLSTFWYLSTPFHLPISLQSRSTLLFFGISLELSLAQAETTILHSGSNRSSRSCVMHFRVTSFLHSLQFHAHFEGSRPPFFTISPIIVQFGHLSCFSLFTDAKVLKSHSLALLTRLGIYLALYSIEIEVFSVPSPSPSPCGFSSIWLALSDFGVYLLPPLVQLLNVCTRSPRGERFVLYFSRSPPGDLCTLIASPSTVLRLSWWVHWRAPLTLRH